MGEIENKQGKNAIAIAHEERVVADLPMNISKYLNLFLKLPGLFLEAEVTGIRVNRGGDKVCVHLVNVA